MLARYRSTLACSAPARYRLATLKSRRFACSLSTATPVMSVEPPAVPGTTGGASEQPAQGPAKRVKRALALHVAYLGTHFKGSQGNRDLPPEETVECLLEKAMHQAGMISDANYGDFFKTKWTRSSRTDKGVHSLGSVFTMKALVQDNFDVDSEGVSVATAINEHLPPYMRVMSAQRVNKSFNARRWCQERAPGDPTAADHQRAAAAGAADAAATPDPEALARFRWALQQFVGRHPFHNYAGNSSSYGNKKRRQAVADAKAAAAAAAASGTAAVAPAEDLPVNAALAVGDDANGTAPAAMSGQVGAPHIGHEPEASAQGISSSGGKDRNQSRRSKRPKRQEDDDDGDDSVGEDDDLGEENEDEAQNDTAADATSEGGLSKLRQIVRWVEYEDSTIGMAHYRTIKHWVCDDPRPLVPGGVPCLRLEVCGNSFMYNQIRNMIGAAVAVARGVLSPELLAASLSAPVRTCVPKAPPYTLLLLDCIFSPFRTAWGDEAPVVAQYSGDGLALRAAGQAARAAFREAQLNAALEPLLRLPDWANFGVKMGRYWYPEEEAGPVLARHKQWYVGYLASKAAKQEARAAQRLKEQAEDDVQAAGV